MHVLVLILLIAAGFALDQAWKRHRIRANFAALRRTILGIRWRPLERFGSARRDESSFRVVYATAEGGRRTCACVASTWGGVSITDERDELPEPRAATRAAPDAAVLPFHAAGFVAALVVCLWIGATYWTAPYRSLELPSALYGSGLVVAIAFAAALTWWRPRSWLAALAWTTAGIVAVVVVRIELDVSRDPTTHNLMPFEVVIAAFVGAVASAIGVGIARLGRLALRTSSAS